MNNIIEDFENFDKKNIENHLDEFLKITKKIGKKTVSSDEYGDQGAKILLMYKWDERVNSLKELLDNASSLSAKYKRELNASVKVVDQLKNMLQAIVNEDRVVAKDIGKKFRKII